MKCRFVGRVATGILAVVALPAAALAQSWVPGSEIVGQSIQVTTNGTTNTVFLDPGGSALVTGSHQA